MLLIWTVNLAAYHAPLGNYLFNVGLPIDVVINF